MQPDELIDRLVAYRVERNEAELYYHLSRLGSCRASELARAAGRSRTEVYKGLEALVERRFVAKTLERPFRYWPLPFEEAMANVLEDATRELDLLRGGAQELARAWPKVTSRLDATAAQYSVHKGMQQVGHGLDHLIDGATEDIFLLAPARFMAKLRSGGALQRLGDKARAGVQVRILTNLDAPDPFLETLGATCQLRHMHLPAHAAALAVDASAVALFISSGRTTSSQHAEETVLVVRAPDFVLGQRALLDCSWRMGLDAPARWLELAGQGVAVRVEVLRGARLRNDRICSMAARAAHRVLVDASPAQARLWQAGEEDVGQALAAATSRGVQVTVRTTWPAPAPGQTSGASGDGQAAVLMDDQEFLFGWRPPGHLKVGEPWAIWTTDPLLGQRLWGLPSTPNAANAANVADAAVASFASPGVKERRPRQPSTRGGNTPAGAAALA